MSRAYLLLNCDIGTEEGIVNELLTINGVSDAYSIRGVYDIIVKLDLESASELRKTIGKIRRTDSVRSSLTLIATQG